MAIFSPLARNNSICGGVVGYALDGLRQAFYGEHADRLLLLRYELLNNAVNLGWNWGGGRSAPEVVSDLRQALSLDGDLRVLVAHGYTDLVTPYFASKLILDQMPAYGRDRRLSLSVYPGGHMFYFRKASRAALRGDALRLYDTALAARQSGAEGR